MAISRVQGAGATADADSVTVDLTSTTEGNLVVALIAGHSGTEPTCTDSESNTYTLFESKAESTDAVLALYYLLDNPGGITSVTGTIGSSSIDCCIWVWEFSGISSAMTYAGAMDSGHSTSPTTGTPAEDTETAYALLLAGMTWESSSSTLSDTTSGFTLESKQTSGTTSVLQSAYNVVTVTGEYAFAGTLSATAYWAAMILPLAGVGSPPSPAQPAIVTQAVSRAANWCRDASGLFVPKRRIFVPSLIRAA